MKVALVHDWLVTYRGGEKVLACLAEQFPEAPIYTLFYDSSKMPEEIRNRKIIYPRWLNKFKKWRKALLPIFPSVIESFNLEDYDLVISTSSCVAKGVISGPNTYHICYIHSPMRYIWDQRYEYLGRILNIPILSFLTEQLLTYLRIWDVSSSTRVDYFIANSNFVKNRVKKYYGRNSQVIFPPIDLNSFSLCFEKKQYFLVAGALVPYKRVDLVVKAFQALGDKLVIAGSGPELDNLKQLALGRSNIEFIESPNDQKFRSLVSEAKALIFPGLEDFGMTPVETMATGTPVIAYKKGGAKDYLLSGINGIWIENQDVESIQASISLFKNKSWDASKIRSSIARFSKESFEESIKLLLAGKKGVDIEI